MDKPTYLIDHSVSHKQGFALIITLSVLAVIIALTGVLIGYLDSVRQDSMQTKAMIQANLYYNDVKQTLQKLKGKKVYPTLYETALPLSSDDGRFSLLLTCKPLANGVNLNWLGYGNSSHMNMQYTMAENVFEWIVQHYDLEDATRLKEMILEEIGGEEKFVEKEQSRLRQKNGIISFKQFEAILSRYQFEADDPKVAVVPWQKFFVFNEIKTDKKGKLLQGDQIDGNYISAELLAMLFDIELTTVKENWIEGESLKAFVHENGGIFEREKLFAKKFLPSSHCEVTYKYAEAQYSFKFIDINGEVKNFEFYGKQ
jgi:hypothetical protein